MAKRVSKGLSTPNAEYGQCKVFIGDLIDKCADLPEQFAHTIITSPPYWTQRDYGTPPVLWPEDNVLGVQVPEMECEFGAEPDVCSYIAHTLFCFDSLSRNLRDDGTIWWVIGDTWKDKRQQFIPELVATALNQRGWYVRNRVVWAKGVSLCDTYVGSVNPSGAKDTMTNAYESILQVTKSPTYFYDSYAVRDRTHNADGTLTTRGLRNVWTVNTVSYKGPHYAVFPPRLVETLVRASTSDAGCCSVCGTPFERIVESVRKPTRPGRDNKFSGMKGKVVGKRDKGRHVTEYQSVGFERNCACRKASAVPCTVFDPFAGSGVTGQVAESMFRRSVMLDINESAIPMIRERLGR